MEIRAQVGHAEKIPRKIETELGVEKFCTECEEYWPLDDEFWYFQWAANGKKRYCAVCKACYDIRYRPARLKLKRAQSEIKSFHEKT